MNKEIDVIEASGDFRSPRVEKRRLTIPIPAGIEDGQTLRMSIGGNKEIFVTVERSQTKNCHMHSGNEGCYKKSFGFG